MEMNEVRRTIVVNMKRMMTVSSVCVLAIGWAGSRIFAEATGAFPLKLIPMHSLRQVLLISPTLLQNPRQLHLISSILLCSLWQILRLSLIQKERGHPWWA